MSETRRDEAPRLEVGEVVAGRYRIEGPLGEGGMGVVYAARHEALETSVAIKVLKADGGGDDHGLARVRFEREARALASLDDDHIARVFDFGVLPDGTPYMAMERLVGDDLGREVRTRGALPLEEAADYVIQACAGLHAAHERGIIHRDVKPSNLFLATRANGERIVKVLDFGIAKIAPTERDPHATRSAMMLGSPLFMSPEQVRSTRDVDLRTDIWALGVVLHYVLAASPPFAGETFASLCAAIAADEPAPLENVPAGLVEVVAKCLRKAPEFRFASASELATALAPFASEAGKRDAARIAKHVTGSRAAPSGVAPSADPMGSTQADPTAAGETSTATAPPAPASAAQSVEPAQAQAKHRARGRLGAIAAIVATGAVVVTLAMVARRGAPAVAPATSATAATAATPAARTEAERAYEQGVNAFHGAAAEMALERFERATTLDPELARAHLQYVAVARDHVDDKSLAHARDARRLRAALTDDERTLLDAFEPLASSTPDLRRTEQRLTAAFDSRPQVADFALHLCRIRVALGDIKRGIEACDAALASTPGLAEAWRAKARAHAFQRDIPRSRESYTACLRASSSATTCLRELSLLDAREGRCDDFEALERRAVAADPDDATSYDQLASVLWIRGAAREAVSAAQRTAVEHVPAEDRDVAREQGQFHIDVAYGNFDGAEQHARKWISIVRPTDGEMAHTAARDALLGLLLEQGRTKEAADVAAALARERAGWTPSPSISFEPVGWPASYRGGALSRRELARVRDAWLARELAQPQAPASGDLPELSWKKPMLWIFAFGAPAVTRDDANEALAAFPAYGGPDPVYSGPEEDAILGRVLALGDRNDDALQPLRASASSCTALAFPVHATQASAGLGAIYELAGRTADACAAYAVVLQRWRAAGAASTTARRADARRAALRCR